jgi:L-alanine-DL-glutamate epimerase-like enolase superfamily enzyme
MRNHAYWHGFGGIVSFAISALDTALWDIAGKAAGLPISAMLGGKLMDRVPSCSSVILNTLDLGALKEEFTSYRERGFTAVKGGWGQVPEAGFGTDRVRDMKVARTVREAIGPDMGMALDVSALAKWSASHAASMAEELLEVNLTWFEDALHHDDHDGYRQMKSRVPTALATGERCWTLHDYQRLVRSNAIDIILVDPGRVEGISGMKAIVDDALTQRVRFVPHSWSSAINTAASLQVYAASTNGEVFEIKPAPSPMQNELVEIPIEQKDGWIAVPNGPGLGITINEKAIKKYLYQG